MPERRLPWYRRAMSLQSRILVLVSAVLLVSIALGSAFAVMHARTTLSAEIRAALLGGVQTVRSAYEVLPRSTHQRQDLVQLVGTFDGNRHVASTLIDEHGDVLAQSRLSASQSLAPLWFERLIAPPFAPVRLIAPGVGRRAVIVLRGAPEVDVGAVWTELSGVVAVLGLATLIGLALVWVSVRSALSPLRDLSSRLTEIGRGDYRGRVRERGPVEVLELERSFNVMAEQLAVIGRRNWSLEQQLLTLQDEERAEIARDLHDEVGPQLFAVSLDAQLITQLLASGRPEAVQDQVDAIQGGVGHIQREIRAMVARLRPARATELGLGRAVQDLTRFWRTRRPEIAFVIEPLPTETDLGDALRDTAFRVVQEAVSNAVRHASPTKIVIALHRSAADLEITVSNDGVRTGDRQDSSGFGLKGMGERVGAAGGELEVRAPEGGERRWIVWARLPRMLGAGAAMPSEALV